MSSCPCAVAPADIASVTAGMVPEEQRLLDRCVERLSSEELHQLLRAFLNDAHVQVAIAFRLSAPDLIERVRAALDPHDRATFDELLPTTFGLAHAHARLDLVVLAHRLASSLPSLR